MKPAALRVRQKDGEIYALNLREVKGKMRKASFREQVRAFAAKYSLPLQEVSPATA